MTRYQEWMRRYVLGHLGTGDELWADLPTHPATAKLRAIAQARGQKIDPDEIKYRITRGLLLGVIHAAGGVEYIVENLVAALDAEQREAARYPAAAPESSSQLALGVRRVGMSRSRRATSWCGSVRSVNGCDRAPMMRLGCSPAWPKASLRNW